MDIHEAIVKRYSVRKYQDRAVPDDLVGAIIESGMNAPSAGNKQSWKFLIVKDDSKRETIAKHCMEQYWMTGAPVHVVICSDDVMNTRFYSEKGKQYGIQNCAAAIQNMLLVAPDLGLGSCLVGAFDENELKFDLDIPEGVSVQGVVTIGYSTRELHSKKILPFERQVFIESYGRRVKSPASYLFNWSVVVQEEIDQIKNGFEEILTSEFKEYSKEIKAKWKKVSKKVDTWFRRHA